MFEPKLILCAAYNCKHNDGCGSCNKSKISVDKDGKCILYYEGKCDITGLPYNEMDEHTNMC